MFCPKCGTQNADGTPFCSSCGAALNGAPHPSAPTYTPPVPSYNPYAAPIVPGKGLGITGMVLGIVALVFMCVWYISIPCGIIGAALSGVGISKARNVGAKNSLATAGLVCSCIALGLAILWIVAIAAALAELGIAIGSLY